MAARKHRIESMQLKLANATTSSSIGSRMKGQFSTFSAQAVGVCVCVSRRPLFISYSLLLLMPELIVIHVKKTFILCDATLTIQF